jgi:hypothetical protein
MKLPLIYENSKIPYYLSYFAPINIWAISFGIWIICRGKLSEKLLRHEMIHYKQQLELAFVGQWLLYLLFHVINLTKFKGNGKKAYFENPFEREAYQNDQDPNYLKNRPKFAWVKYIK